VTELKTIQPYRLKLALREAVTNRGMEYTTVQERSAA
jgi:hypothetical protein